MSDKKIALNLQKKLGKRSFMGKNNDIKKLDKLALKNIQSRFFRGNVSAQRGFFITKEDADDLRKKVIRPIRSKKSF